MAVTGIECGAPEQIRHGLNATPVRRLQLLWTVEFGAGSGVPNPLFNADGWLDLGLELCLLGSWPKQ